MAGAIFLDRDGVINYNREDYVKSPEEFLFLPGAPQAVARLTRAGRLLFVVSNQAGVGRGRMRREDLEAVTRKMLEGLESAGARIRQVYYCVHHPEDACGCRKPAPGLLERAAREHGVDLTRSIVVGDHARDLAAGQACGARTVLVLSGMTSGEDVEHLPNPPDHVAVSLGAAVEWILDSTVRLLRPAERHE
jgi:histidinol-phosphate phosphatase family protein